MSIQSRILSDIQIPLHALGSLITQHAPAVIDAAVPEAATLLTSELATLGWTVSEVQATELVTALFALIKKEL